jgi:NAD(P)-dependent dehydrogenase (short-subunit alcohol dehydrogenase family)
MKSLKGKVALITGSTGGIGKAILLALAKEGCKVIIHSHKNNSDLKALLKVIKPKYKNPFYIADLTKEKEVEKLFKEIKKDHKKLDILVNNVGNYLKKDLSKLTVSEWHNIIDSNLNITFYCTYFSLPLLRKNSSGRIINIGFASTGQIVAKPGILPYQIAKTGILLMTKAYAKTEGKNDILINMISPGVMENSLSKPLDDIPLGKLGRLEGIAELAVQTIKSDYITGTNIEYAGGFNL